MKSLWLKEWRYLLHLLPLFLLFFCGDLVYLPLTQPLDETSWFDLHSGLDPDSGAPIFLYMMGIMIGFSLFPREYEEHTIDFLHSLPVTRRQIFLAKFLAGLTLISVVCVARELVIAFFGSFDGDPLTAGLFSWTTAAELLFTSFLTAFVGLAHGLLLSFGRQFGFLLLGFAFYAVNWLSKVAPNFNEVDPLSISEPVFNGRQLVLPWDVICWQFVGAVVALLVSHRLWSSRGYQGTQLTVEGVKRRRKSVGCITVFAVVLLLILWIRSNDSDDSAKDAPVLTTARMTTRHYVFTFPTKVRHRAEALANAGDPIYEYVDKQLGGVDKATIVADLTDQSEEHLGIASLNKLRVDILDNTEPSLLQHILCHETAHVLCARLAGARGRKHSEALAFFSEGYAEYVSYQRAPSTRSRVNARRQAMAMMELHRLKFSTLVSDELKERYDEDERYTLGEVWVQALVDCYGPGAPAKVWRAVGRADAPKLKNPQTFWQDTLQAAGFSFEKVRNRWVLILRSLKEQEADFLQSLPKLRGSVVSYDDDRYVQIHCDKPMPKDWPGLVVRVRARHSDETQGLSVEATDDPKVFEAAVPPAYGDTFDYQFGVLFSEGTYPIMDEWKTLTGSR